MKRREREIIITARSGSHANELQDEIDRKNVGQMMADNRYSSLTQHPMASLSFFIFWRLIEFSPVVNVREQVPPGGLGFFFFLIVFFTGIETNK